MTRFSCISTTIVSAVTGVVSSVGIGILIVVEFVETFDSDSSSVVADVIEIVVV